MGYAHRKALVLAGILSASITVFAASPHQKKKTGSSTAGTEAAISVDIFVEKDRQVIRDYYAGQLPPGLSKREGNLPPGLERQLLRKGRLPPGLDKRMTAFPARLESRLSPLKPGLVRVFIQGQAVIYNPKLSVVLDVFVVLP